MDNQLTNTPVILNNRLFLNGVLQMDFKFEDIPNKPPTGSITINGILFNNVGLRPQKRTIYTESDVKLIVEKNGTMNVIDHRKGSPADPSKLLRKI